MRHPFLWLILCLATPVWAQWPPHGFAETRAGVRTSDDPQQRDTSLAEVRVQLEFNHLWDALELMVRADGRYDDLDEDHSSIDLERGEGPLDLREAWLQFSPTDTMDVKVGRQILTWGNGDLLFINDLFPKDWQSFFSGRDTEYLKAPSDALFASFFPQWGSVDLVYVPTFDPDRHLTGARFSVYNPMAGGLTGRDQVMITHQPKQAFDSDEIALRVSGNRNGLEWAFYGYDGYWKSPQGFDPTSGKATFPRLRVWGASLRGSLGKGLFVAETGFYDSLDDKEGCNPLLPNSEWRFLLGFERELGRNFSGAWQYYVENMRKYAEYETVLPQGMPARDRNRMVFTQRLTLRRMKDNLTLSLFTYVSPTDRDGYARPSITYKLNDDWQLSTGGNIFWGKQQHTFFGQFEDGSNLYASVRYSF